MKNLKLTRKIQIILVTMLVIIIGTMIVAKISNDRLMGYTSTALGTTGTAKPSELFDRAGKNADGLHIGDFVNYDAGKWTQDEIDAINANGSTDFPSKAYQFGGFTVDSSRNENAQPYIYEGDEMTHDYLKDKATNQEITGWRVFDIKGDKVTLISAGNPENYYHFNRIWFCI